MLLFATALAAAIIFQRCHTYVEALLPITLMRHARHSARRYFADMLRCR